MSSKPNKLKGLGDRLLKSMSQICDKYSNIETDEEEVVIDLSKLDNSAAKISNWKTLFVNDFCATETSDVEYWSDCSASSGFVNDSSASFGNVLDETPSAKQPTLEPRAVDQHSPSPQSNERKDVKQEKKASYITTNLRRSKRNNGKKNCSKEKPESDVLNISSDCNNSANDSGYGQEADKKTLQHKEVEVQSKVDANHMIQSKQGLDNCSKKESNGRCCRSLRKSKRVSQNKHFSEINNCIKMKNENQKLTSQSENEDCLFTEIPSENLLNSENENQMTTEMNENESLEIHNNKMQELFWNSLKERLRCVSNTENNCNQQINVQCESNKRNEGNETNSFRNEPIPLQSKYKASDGKQSTMFPHALKISVDDECLSVVTKQLKLNNLKSESHLKQGLKGSGKNPSTVNGNLAVFNPSQVVEEAVDINPNNHSPFVNKAVFKQNVFTTKSKRTMTQNREEALPIDLATNETLLLTDYHSPKPKAKLPRLWNYRSMSCSPSIDNPFEDKVKLIDAFSPNCAAPETESATYGNHSRNPSIGCVASNFQEMPSEKRESISKEKYCSKLGTSLLHPNKRGNQSLCLNPTENVHLNRINSSLSFNVNHSLTKSKDWSQRIASFVEL